VLQRPVEPAQYTSIRYTQRLEDIGAARSVGSKGDSYDNAAAEAVNSLYKKELINREGAVARHRAGDRGNSRMGVVVQRR
jgi:transposase InsO family protein